MSADPGLLAAQLDGLQETLERSRALLPAIAGAGAEIRQALLSGGKLLTAGNGGSAADALHLAEELVGRFDKERPSLPAISLLAATPRCSPASATITATSGSFPGRSRAWGVPGDVLVVFSTSGNSPNLVAALNTANARGLKTVAVLGKTGGAAKGLATMRSSCPAGSRRASRRFTRSSCTAG
jgi:D-sedoheptulose 7-phosphate isomerase